MPDPKNVFAVADASVILKVDVPAFIVAVPAINTFPVPESVMVDDPQLSVAPAVVLNAVVEESAKFPVLKVPTSMKTAPDAASDSASSIVNWLAAVAPRCS